MRRILSTGLTLALLHTRGLKGLLVHPHLNGDDRHRVAAGRDASGCHGAPRRSDSEALLVQRDALHVLNLGPGLTASMVSFGSTGP